MSEQKELEFPEPAVSYRSEMARFFPWLDCSDEISADMTSPFWYPNGQRLSWRMKEATVIANYQAKARLGDRLGPARWDASLPTSPDDRKFLVEQRIKTQLMATLRTAQLALREKDELVQQNHNLTETVHSLVATGHLLTSCLAARNNGRVCLHEHYSGTVSEIVGDQIVVVYEVDDGEPMKQVYDRKQFIADHIPREGDELCAYVFITQHPTGRAIAESLTGTKTEPDFSGFEKSVVGDAEI